jgi:hypothetical protein
MSDVRAGDPVPFRGVSFLIYGQGEAPMAVLAAALARDEVGSFGWADCAAAAEPPEPGARRVLEESAAAADSSLVRPEDLLPPRTDAGHLAMWLAPDPLSAESGARLAAYLRLPSVLQRMVSRVTSVNARAVVLLTNVDAIPAATRDLALGPAALYETLRREGVCLLVTFRGTPPENFREPFDRIYRVEGRPDQPWQEAWVTPERGEPATAGATLGHRYPGLSLSGSPFETDPPIRGHRLR